MVEITLAAAERASTRGTCLTAFFRVRHWCYRHFRGKWCCNRVSRDNGATYVQPFSRKLVLQSTFFTDIGATAISRDIVATKPFSRDNVATKLFSRNVLCYKTVFARHFMLQDGFRATLVLQPFLPQNELPSLSKALEIYKNITPTTAVD